jgi:hypothetical protein
VAVAVIVLAPVPFFNHDWFVVILDVSVGLGLLWVSIIAAGLRNELPDAGGRTALRPAPVG